MGGFRGRGSPARGRSWVWGSGALAALTTTSLLTPATGRACGGFFCSTAPVVQSGEVIVYGIEDDGTLTMSIRLESQGMDDDFAWILPLTVAPTEISIGTDALFDQLELATRPYFVREPPTVEGECRAEPTCYVRPNTRHDPYGSGYFSGGGCGFSRGGAPGMRPPSFESLDAAGPLPDVVRPAAPDAAWMTSMDGGVAVLREERVGPYDTVVLGAATAAEVLEWLRSHDYDVPEGADSRLEAYAAAHHVFLALRLSSNAPMATVRPITLRLPTSEACLPIRLTAISTVPDMPIHAYFLARAPVTPLNYNVADPVFSGIGLWQGIESYQRYADRAIDGLGGHAFSPLFSGPTPLVPVALPDVRDLGEVTDAALFLRALVDRGYRPNDLVLREVLDRHFASPTASTSNVDYWNCLVAAGDQDECGGAPLSFDPLRAAEDVYATITVPREEARRLIERLPHLTRLYTSMSDFEMDVDPVFVVDAGLEDVSNVHTLTQERACSDRYLEEDAPLHGRLPSGATVVLDPGFPSTDESYCARSGRITRAEYDRLLAVADAGTRPAPPARSSGGCCGCGSCSISPLPRTASVPVLLFLLAVWRRRARTRPR